MSVSQPLPVKTASPSHSIWRDVNESAFRTRIDQLHRKNDLPADSKVHTYQTWHNRSGAARESRHSLPLDVEERVANDIAFIAATRKDVMAVTAVALEEQSDAHGLIIRLAANGAIQASVIDGLKSIFALLQECAVRRISREKCRDEIFTSVIHLNRERMHALLQSEHYKPPKKHNNQNRQPLCHELQGLSRHVKSIKKSVDLSKKLTALSTLYRRVDDCTRNTAEEELLLKTLAQQSFDFCTPKGCSIEQTVAFYGFKDHKILENKQIRQVNKLGRYWGLCRDMVEASRKHGDIFASIGLLPLTRYESCTALISNKVGMIPCYVHAEIQLLVFYYLHPTPTAPRPRVLGVSKAACYLCNLFILNHQRFFITRTHGKLYPMWTVPDLAEYSQSQLSDIRRVLKSMDTEIQKASAKPYLGRQWPMESFVHLPPQFLTSPVASDLGTLLSTRSNGSPAAALPPEQEQSATTSVNQVAESLSPKDSHEIVRSPVESLPSVLVSSLEADTAVPDACASRSKTPSPSRPSSIPAPHIRDKAVSQGSSSSVRSFENLAQHTIAASVPAYAQVEDIHFFLEIDGESEGTCKFAKVPVIEGRILDNALELQAMEPNEERQFSKNADDDQLVLNLRASPSRLLQLSIQWK